LFFGDIKAECDRSTFAPSRPDWIETTHLCRSS
jgi:hypothetical protein